MPIKAFTMLSFSKDNAIEQFTKHANNVYNNFISLPLSIPQQTLSQTSPSPSHNSSQLTRPSLPRDLLRVANASNYVAWSAEKHAVFLK